MGQNNIDQYIKETMMNHEVFVDKDLLWDSINKRKRYPLALIFTRAGIVLLFLLGAVAIWNTGHTDEVQTDPQNFNNNPVILETDLQEETTEIVHSSEHDDSTASSEELNKASDIDSEIKDLDPQGSEPQLSAYNIESTNASDNQVMESRAQLDQNINSMLNSNKPDTHSENAALASTVLYSSDQDIIQSIETHTKTINTRSLGIADLSSIGTVEVQLVKLDAVPEMSLSTTDCPSFSKKTSRMFVEAYSTVDYIMNSYTTAQEYTDYLEEREASQAYRPSYRAGVQAKYLLDMGLFFRAGIQYSVAREKFRYRTETITTEILPNQIINIHIDMNGDSIITLGNAPVTTIETRNWRVKNEYKSLDIPISVGYQIDKGKWFYTAELGIAYNLNFAFNGMVLDDNLEPLQAGSYFKDKTGLNYTAGLAAGYKLRPNMNLMFRLSMRTQQSNINTAVNLIDQKYTTVGTGLGLEYEF